MLRRVFWVLPLAAAVFAVGRDKGQDWLQVNSPHFVVVSNAGEKQARHVADQFERMRSVFHKVFPSMQVDSGPTIVVLALKDEKDFRALEPQDYLGKGKLQLAGLFLRTSEKNYVLMRLDAEGEHPYSTIYHEYTHLLSSKAEDTLPLWLDEGLAEFFQNTDIQNKEVLLGEPSTDNILLLREHRLLPLATLFTVDHASPYYHEENKGSIFYAESWALTHYLEIKDQTDKTSQIANYATLLSKKVDPVAAGTQAFGDLQQLQKSLEKYIEQGSFHYFKMESSTSVDDSTFQTKPLTQIQADAVRADFLANNQRFADAHTLLEQILHEDPNNVSAHETMGFLAFREGKLEEARKWYSQAVALDSQSYLAHYYFAAISMNSGTLSGDEETQVESSLRAAIKLNPTFAPSYDRLAAFYGSRRRNLDEARTLSLQAVQLDPSNQMYRLDCASVLLSMERPKDAISVIQKAMNLAKSPAEQNRAQMYLTQAQNYEAAQERMEEYRQRASQEAQPEVSVKRELGKPELGKPEPPDTDRPTLTHRQEAAPRGPHHFVSGIIKKVECSSPALMNLSIESGGHLIELHAGNYYRVDFTALNFTPTGELQPCTQLEGVHAKVEFIEASDKTVKGWIVAVELRK